MGKKAVSDAFLKAGEANLAAWKKDHPSDAALKHGVFSPAVRGRFSDRRYKEGKALHAFESALIARIGGPEHVDDVLEAELALCRSYFITVYLIGHYIDVQPSLITKDGQLIPILGKGGLVTYGNALGKSIQNVLKLGKPEKPGKIPSISEIIKNARETS